MQVLPTDRPQIAGGPFSKLTPPLKKNITSFLDLEAFCCLTATAKAFSLETIIPHNKVEALLTRVLQPLDWDVSSLPQNGKWKRIYDAHRACVQTIDLFGKPAFPALTHVTLYFPHVKHL